MALYFCSRTGTSQFAFGRGRVCTLELYLEIIGLRTLRLPTYFLDRSAGANLDHRIAALDSVLPKILAGEKVSKSSLALLGHGGLCQTLTTAGSI
jgi:hypothetical protein